MDFASFVEQQLPRLRAYAARMPGAKPADIDDLLQEALLRAYVVRERFESDEHAVNWICQVVRNLLVDRHRRWLRRPAGPDVRANVRSREVWSSGEQCRRN